MRYLTKSRFKLALECPTKLYYTRKPKEYKDNSLEDRFLRALAWGGYQVGELAKYYYPGGVEISSRKYDESLAETERHIRNENIILYEPAIKYDNPPLQAVFCENGYTNGTYSKITNPPEADKIAKTITKLTKNDKYDGKTFGVIVLQGNLQWKIIDDLILESIGPGEYSKRKIVCGNSASFQGDERDVMFLSLVTAPNHNRTSLTTPEDERRFNVAMSRAIEQVWLFHSVQIDDLSPKDLRYKLLNHFKYTDKPSIIDDQELIDIPKDRKMGSQPKPFDSWFEVDVYNDIILKGHKVIPQYEVAGGRYVIDLVALLGDGTKIAIECDGDAYHGPEQAQSDIVRQKNLERCGWQFFRVSGAEYYSNREASLEPLWKILTPPKRKVPVRVDPEVDGIPSNNSTHEIPDATIGDKQANHGADEIGLWPRANPDKKGIQQHLSFEDDNSETFLKPKVKKSEWAYKSKELLIFTSNCNVYKWRNRNRVHLDEYTLLQQIEMAPKEKPIYITGTDDYSGYLVAGFDNGKFSKVFISSYRTQNQRKKLKNAIHADSKLKFIEHIDDEIDLVMVSSLNKVLLFNTGDLHPKLSTKSSGVQVMKLKGDSRVRTIKHPDFKKFENIEYYRKNVPAIGNYLLRQDRY